ncbi:metal-dependent hydrolase [Shimia ponticola]|uniref:metal-dependent hydrolase n=1 Tax=Shimia ponticola TaxID=2582893 RepID=UPI0011BFC01F|nr:metal-dependent hydrolase [Shimia ponticola]
MKLVWMGHASFRLEAAGQIILIDPWINGNPMLTADQVEQALDGATHILVTHGHFDHATDVVEVSQKTGAPVSGIVELAGTLHDQGAVEGYAFNKGGTVDVGDVKVSLVPASHSSSMKVDGTGRYMGAECGFMIKAEGKTIYVSGDTDIMADMDWMADYYKPQVGILSAGGHYTMDMAGAAYAAKRYFDFETVIPCHYKTFPALAQDAEPLIAGLPDVNVIEPVVMQPIKL